ncbi:hypothetical protein Y032_0069g311 [Ancylostoma ceylanicum]|uniref:Uncharacterized protein n=1 Tax=Ancylostoma ceylanicum TaxID=53326 RepID=A0A016TXX6_9BILA|nr:hypothetical protein Y032_0069g311 [Ancylostoma ceylanicum]
MTRVVLCLAVVAFAYAAPPIVPQPAQPVAAKPEPAKTAPAKPGAATSGFVKPVPIKPELLKFEPIVLEPVDPEPALSQLDEVVEASGPCDDGVNNVIQVADVGDSLRIHTKGVVAHTYDENGNPTCYKGRARLSLPGIIKLVNGTIIVTAPSDLKKSGDVLMTLTKNSRFVGTVCKDGNSKSRLISDDLW